MVRIRPFQGLDRGSCPLLAAQRVKNLFSLFSLAGCPVKKHPYYRGLEERSLGAPIRRRRWFKSSTRNPKLTFKFRETHPSFRCVKLEYLQLVTIPNVLGRNNTWIRGGRRLIFRIRGYGVIGRRTRLNERITRNEFLSIDVCWLIWCQKWRAGSSPATRTVSVVQWQNSGLWYHICGFNSHLAPREQQNWHMHTAKNRDSVGSSPTSRTFLSV